MRSIRLFLLIPALLGLAVQAQGSWSPEALSLLDPGGMSAALGGAMVSRAGFLESAHYNPAGLAGLERFKTSFCFDIRRDDFIKLNISAAKPFLDRRLFLQYNVLMFKSTSYHSNNTWIRDDLPLGLDPDFRMIQSLTVTGLPLKWLAIGGSFKFFLINGDWGDKFFVFDLGLHAAVPGTRLTLGLALQNIHPELNPEHGSPPVPFVFRGGASYRVLNLFDHKVTTSVDVVKADGHVTELALGTEYLLMENYLARIGWHTHDTLPRFGIGYRNSTIDVSLECDITFQKNDQNGTVLTFGFTVGF